LRGFPGLCVQETPPERSTSSQRRRLSDLEAHRAVCTWILQMLATAEHALDMETRAIIAVTVQDAPLPVQRSAIRAVTAREQAAGLTDHVEPATTPDRLLTIKSARRRAGRTRPCRQDGRRIPREC
jgi:hypothetical protein